MSFPAQVVSATTRDPAEYELVLRPWELHCVPQTAGNFQHRITAIRAPLFVIYRERYDLALSIQGLSPDGMLAFCVPLDFNAQSYFWGNRVADTEIPGMLPGPVDVRFGDGQTIMVALISFHYLQEVLSQESVAKLQAAGQLRRFQAPASAINDFAKWGRKLLDVAEAHPGRFDQPAVAESILHELVDFLVLVADSQPSRRPIADLTTRRKGLARAMEFLRYRLDSRVSMAELCGAARISERSLQTVFQEEFGISPTEFMRRRRLHAARQKLLTSSRAETSVSEVAMECGFHELGRFAVEYRRLFGIRPSTTLDREFANSKLVEQHLMLR